MWRSAWSLDSPRTEDGIESSGVVARCQVQYQLNRGEDLGPPAGAGTGESGPDEVVNGLVGVFHLSIPPEDGAVMSVSSCS